MHALDGGLFTVNVLFVAHDSGLFGAQRTLLTLLGSIDRNRFNCLVAVPHQGPFVEEVNALRLPHSETPRIRWVPEAGQVARESRVRWIGRLLFGLRSRSAALASLIEKHRIDLVYTNTVVCLEGAIAARIARVPHVWHIHEPVSGNPELGALFPDWLYASLIHHLSDRIVFCSRSVASTYPKLAKHAEIVFNGLPVLDPIDRNLARDRLVRDCPIPPGRPLVAVVGAIHPRKDHLTFLRAAFKLHQSRPDVIFLVAGADATGDMPELRAQVEALGLIGTVRLIGWWPGPIHEFMAGIDVLAVSSIQESFGLTVLEAFAAGTPVVSTRCGGPEEIIRHGIDGYLVPIGDADALAARIGELIDAPATAAKFATAGRANFQEQFTVEAYTSALERVIETTFHRHEESRRHRAARSTS